MVTIAQLDFDHLYIPRTTQGQPWPLALGSGFLISPTDPGPAGPRDLASPTDPGPAGPGILWPCRARAGPDSSLGYVVNSAPSTRKERTWMGTNKKYT